MREPLAHWPEILHEEPVLQNCIGNLVIWTRARFRPCVTTSRRETGFVHVRLLGILTSSSSFILPIPSFQSLLFDELATFSRRTGIMRLLNSSGLRADILKLFNKTRALSLKLADWYTCSLFDGIFGVDLYYTCVFRWSLIDLFGRIEKKWWILKSLTINCDLFMLLTGISWLRKNREK